MTSDVQIAPEESLLCALCRPDFSALIDGELDETRRVEIERHLATAPPDCTCLQELDACKKSGDLYRTVPPLSAPPGFSQAVTAQVDRNARRRRSLRKLMPLAPVLLVIALFVLVAAPGDLMWPTSPGAVLENPPRSMELAQREFIWKEGRWEEGGFQDQALTSVAPASDAWHSLVQQEPALATLLELNEPIVFQAGEVWYLIGGSE